MAPEVEWQDTNIEANRLLTMVCAVLIDRHGPTTVSQAEWDALNAKYGGQAAVLFARDEPDAPLRAYIDTVGSIAQSHGDPN